MSGMWQKETTEPYARACRGVHKQCRCYRRGSHGAYFRYCKKKSPLAVSNREGPESRRVPRLLDNQGFREMEEMGFGDGKDRSVVIETPLALSVCGHFVSGVCVVRGHCVSL